MKIWGGEEVYEAQKLNQTQVFFFLTLQNFKIVKLRMKTGVLKKQKQCVAAMNKNCQQNVHVPHFWVCAQ